MLYIQYHYPEAAIMSDEQKNYIKLISEKLKEIEDSLKSKYECSICMENTRETKGFDDSWPLPGSNPDFTPFGENPPVPGYIHSASKKK